MNDDENIYIYQRKTWLHKESKVRILHRMNRIILHRKQTQPLIYTRMMFTINLYASYFWMVIKTHGFIIEARATDLPAGLSVSLFFNSYVYVPNTDIYIVNLVDDNEDNQMRILVTMRSMKHNP